MDDDGLGGGVFPHSSSSMLSSSSSSSMGGAAGGGACPSGNITTMDLDLVDELLLGGCWLETTDGSDFFFHNNTTTDAFDSWPPPPPPLLDSRCTTTINTYHEDTKDDSCSGSVSGLTNYNYSTLMSNPPQPSSSSSAALVNHHHHATQQQPPPPPLPYNFHSGTSDLHNLIWISPSTTSPLSVTDRLITALNHISTRNKDILIQIWVPILHTSSTSTTSRRVLTTINQPFALDASSLRLVNYRTISESYHFAADADESSGVRHGLPGRVYVDKVPEWTPDVRFFTADEYPRVVHAKEYGVRGTLALPVFEQGSQSCLGVIEVVLTTRKVNYRPEIEDVCNALRSVHLESSPIPPSSPFVKETLPPTPTPPPTTSYTYQSAIPEILQVLTTASHTHNLPLSQTWVPCIQQEGKSGCRHSRNNLTRCVSPIDAACVITDPKFRPFHEACAEHHLLKGQGVAGRAFLANQPCFSPDVTRYAQTEYPLSHHARMFGLCAAVAIRLRSVCSGDGVDFVLEFFLPVGCRDGEGQRRMLGDLSMVVQRVARSLRVVTDEEMEIERRNHDGRSRECGGGFSHDSPPSTRCTTSSISTYNVEPEYAAATHNHNHNQTSVVGFPIDHHHPHPLLNKEQERRRDDTTFQLNDTNNNNNTNTAALAAAATRCENDDDDEDHPHDTTIKSSGERKRIKSSTSSADNHNKPITLDVLRQHFAGSLKDAAKSMGVCPTTLKRICRQHGIKRWPSRKIKKVGHSLQKLQVVIDSVHGGSAAAASGFQLGSFYSNFPDLQQGTSSSSSLSPNNLSTSPFSRLNNSSPVPVVAPPTTTTTTVHEGHHPSPTSTATSKSPPSSSSCSQTSSSSQCCSSGGTPQQNHQQQQQPVNTAAAAEEPLLRSLSGGSALKRVRSETEVNHLSTTKTDPTQVMMVSRSHSQKTITAHQSTQPRQPSTLPTKQDNQVAAAAAAAPPHHHDVLWRVKVTYGDEKIRFRLRRGWGYRELSQEVVKRFDIGDLNAFHLKYLDDDSEWVLLTCDADLDECIDICCCRSTTTMTTTTIRLSLGLSSVTGSHHSRSSVGSNRFT